MSCFSCKDCTERYIGCHIKCEKYINEKKEFVEKITEYNKSKVRPISLYDFNKNLGKKHKR